MYIRTSNVWESGAETPEAAIGLKIRADLMIKLREIIHANGWSQKEAGEQLGLTQNRVSYIINGQVSKFTTERLIELLSKIGYTVTVGVQAAA